jgi:hypothetical protein
MKSPKNSTEYAMYRGMIYYLTPLFLGLFAQRCTYFADEAHQPLKELHLQHNIESDQTRVLVLLGIAATIRWKSYSV